MTKHTIELSKEEIRIINVIKAVNDVKSIDKAISFIIEDYGKQKKYLRFIKEVRNYE